MGMKFQIQRRVEFRDTDAAGIVHFSNFFVYMEQAEHAFLRSIGLGVVSELDGKKVSWPRVSAKCDYRTSIRFEELIDIELFVARMGSKSVTYEHKFHRGGELVAEGSVTVVCCVFEPGRSMQSIEIPAKFVEALKPYGNVSCKL